MSNILEVYGLSGNQSTRCTSREYSGPCPLCGGEDRFRMWVDEERFWCRRCDTSGGIDKLARLVKNPISRNTCSDNKYHTRRNRYTSSMRVKPDIPQIDIELYKGFVYASKKKAASRYRSKHFDRFLQSRGISIETSKRFSLGFSDRLIPNIHDTTKKSYFPKGVVIPNYRDDNLYSIKVRTLDGISPKYLQVKDCPLIPYLIKSDVSNTPIIIVESELDAILLAQEGGDFFQYIALSSINVTLDRITYDMIRKSGKIWFCPDYDDAGLQGFKRWKKLYPNIDLALLPKGKDPTEAKLAGVDLKEWMLGLREIGGRSAPKIRTKKFEYHLCADNNDFYDKFKNFEYDDSTTDMPLLAIAYDKEKDIISFSNSNGYTLTAYISQIDLDWESIADKFDITCFDATILKCDLGIRGCKKNFHSIRYMYHALTSKGKSCTIWSIGNYYLGHGGGLPCLFDENHNLSDEDIISGDTVSIFLLHDIFKKLLLKRDNKQKLEGYRLISRTQNSLSEMMINGIPVDWDVYDDIINESDNTLDYRKHKCDDGRLRSIYDPCGAETGRITTSQCCLHSFPNIFKKSVKADEGYVIVRADYKQSEMRIVAAISKDSRMLEFLESGKDIHASTIAYIKKCKIDEVTKADRDIAKIVNFSFLYGAKVNSIFEELKNIGIECTKDNIIELLNKLASLYDDLCKWKISTLKNCSEHSDLEGEYPHTCVYTAFGRRIPIWTLDYRWHSKALNNTIQGTGADMLMLSLSTLYDKLIDFDCRIIHCAHDEILIEALETQAEEVSQILRSAMEAAFKQIFKDLSTENLVDITIAKSWGEAKE